jgi:hypothetical protein
MVFINSLLRILNKFRISIVVLSGIKPQGRGGMARALSELGLLSSKYLGSTGLEMIRLDIVYILLYP